MKNIIARNYQTQSSRKPLLSLDSINGFYLSLLATGVLVVILKFDISNDLKQGLFFILLWLIFGSIDLFNNASKIASTVNDNPPQNIIYGNYYDRVENIVSNTSNRQTTDIKLDTPSNYFDVLKTIEIVPVSPDPNKAGIRDALIEFQSYVESDYSLSLSEKEAILEVIKYIAIEARLNPNNDDLEYIVSSIQGIDRNSSFQDRIISALKASGQTLDVIKILISTIDGWKETERK
jgi:hypothetical protein